MRQYEYTEGQEALQNFKQLATAVLQAQRPKKKTKQQPKAATSRKSKRSDKD